MAIDPATLFTSVKAAYDIAKGINSLNTTVERNEAVSKVLEILLSVQSDALLMKEKHSVLLSEIDSLKKKILEFENWSDTEKKYELKEVATQTFLYAYKKSETNPQPSHYICPQCYQDKKTYILQLYYEGEGTTQYQCTNCKTIIKIRHGSSGSTPQRGPGGPHSWMGR